MPLFFMKIKDKAEKTTPPHDAMLWICLFTSVAVPVGVKDLPALRHPEGPQRLSPVVQMLSAPKSQPSPASACHQGAGGHSPQLEEAGVPGNGTPLPHKAHKDQEKQTDNTGEPSKQEHNPLMGFICSILLGCLHGRQQALLSPSRWVCGLMRSSNELLSIRGGKWAAVPSCSLRSSRDGEGMLQEHSKGAGVPIRLSLTLMPLGGWSVFKCCPPGICSSLHVLGGVILPLKLTPTH